MTGNYQLFLDYLSRELNYSPRTVEAYGSDLRQWITWATDGEPAQMDETSVTLQDLRVYMAHLGEQGVSARSIKRKIQSLRAFYKFMMRHRGLKANPALELKAAKLPKPLPVYIREQEIEAILADEPRDTYMEARLSLIVDMLYNTGMRVSELCSLKDRDVNTLAGELKVMGKRRKERIIPFGKELAGAIDDFRRLRDAKFGKSEDREMPLFLNNKCRPMDRTQVSHQVHDLLAQGGAHAQRLSPHVLRHCCATDMLKHGASLVSVKAMLGHASLASTQIYTHLSFQELQQVYNQAHPRARKK